MRRLVQRLRRALAVEPGEEAIVAWAAITLFLIEWASVAVSNASDTLFLKRVGVQYIPIVFLVNSVLLTATTLGAGRLAVLFSQRRLLTATFAALAAILIVLWALVLTAAPGIATTLVLASKQIDVIAALMFWTVVGGLMTSRQSKRLVALMTAGGTLGTILGSFTSSLFGRMFGIPSLLGIAAATFASAALATIPLGRSARPRLYRRGATQPAEREQRLPLRSIWQGSSLFRALVCTSFLAGMLGPMLYYEFSSAADLATRTADGEQKLLELYGLLRGWINVGVLALQIGASAALFRRIGVPLAATLSPAAYLVGLGGLGISFGLPTAMPASMGTSVLDHTIYEPAQRILAALLPLRIRTAATSLIQGPAKRGGAALGSLLILGIVAVSQDPSTIAMVGIPIAGLWMALAVALWRNYPNLLLEAASVRGAEPGGPAGEDARVAFLDPGTMRMLRQNLESEDLNLCAAACGLFADAPPAEAIEALTHAIPGSAAACRPVLFETLDHILSETAAAAPARGAALLSLPGAAARGPTAAAVADSAVAALNNLPDLAAGEAATLVHLLGRAALGCDITGELREVLARHSQSSESSLRVAAQAACIRAGISEDLHEPWETQVEQALASGDAGSRRVALAELRLELLRGDEQDPAWTRRLELLARHLRIRDSADRGVGNGIEGQSPAGTVPGHGCWRAVTALADVAAAHRDAVSGCASLVLAQADDPDPEVRSAALRFIGNAGLTEHARLLAERLSSRSVLEAAAASSALESLGAAAADAMLHALRHGRRRAREALPAILREVHIDPQTLLAAIDREIDYSQHMLVVAGVLDASQASRLLLQRIRERVDESLRVALELIATILEDERIANVCRSLGRALNVRDRAVLLEALEALLPPAERDRILPLLEEQGAQRLAANAAQALGTRLPTLEEAIGQLLAGGDPLASALVAATMDSRILSRAAPGLDVKTALRVFSRPQDQGAGADGGAPAAVAKKEVPLLSQVETMLHLRALDLFEGLTTRQLSELAAVVREVTVDDGKPIVTEGEFDDRMYFIVDGSVRIDKAGQQVAELGPRDFFGEMAVFDGETRSATATAVGQVRLLRLARSDLFEVMEDQPAIGIGICQTLVRRVRNMLEELSNHSGGH